MARKAPGSTRYLMHRPKDKHDTVVWALHRMRNGRLRPRVSLNGSVVMLGTPTRRRTEAIAEALSLAAFVRSGLDFVRED